MSKLHVEADGTTHAPPDVVGGAHRGCHRLARWGPWDASGYERPGDASEHGVGAVRSLRYGRTTTIERVLDVEAGRRIDYSVERGIPVRNYRASVTLTPAGAGTRIHWAATWDATLADRIVRWKLRTIYPEVVARLVAAANAGVAAP